MPAADKTTKPKPSADSPKTAAPPIEPQARTQGGAKSRRAGSGTTTVSPEALALAARMIEQCSDPEGVARDLGTSLAEAAEALLAGARIKGPMGAGSLAMLGRILGASWAQAAPAAKRAADGRQEFAARVSAALSARLAPPGVRAGHESGAADGRPAPKLPF